MEESISSCNRCIHLGHCCPGGPFLQVGKGPGRKVLVVAESPAKNGWRKSGRAFHTPDGTMLATGKRLNEYLKRFGLTVGDISFTELVKCYLSDRKLLERSGHNCFGHLQAQIKALNPSLVITLGVIPNKVFALELGTDLPLGSLHTVGSFAYLPLYHPSPASPHGHKKNMEILDRFNDEIGRIVST